MIRLRCPGCMEILTENNNICPHCGYRIDSAPAEPIYLQPGTFFHNRYTIGKTLGSGGFGVTYLAWDGKLEQKVAIKEYMPGEFSTRAPGQSTVTVFSGDRSEQFYAGMHKFHEEAKKLAKFINEDGIVKIFDSFEENGTAYIVMEYLEGMTLSDYLKEKGTISEDDAVALMMPVMKSLSKVHNAGILHRDIAPDNIFVTKKGEFKLIDFGASRFATTTHSRSLTVMIKPGYSAEEQYRSRGDQGTHTDVYSLAATMYKMITGHTPPDAMERRAKYENQNKDILEPPHKYVKGLSRSREIAILNGMNVRVEDRTPDVGTFISELEANPPAKRRYGKIKKLDIYTWPLWLKIGIGSLLAILVAFGILLAMGVIKFNSNYSDEVIIPENMVEVPDVEGLKNDEAIKLIEQGKLIARASGNVKSKYVEAGKIVFQSPDAGIFKEINSVIDLTVSSGTGEIIDVVDGKATVPYVIWDTKADALDKIELSGLGTPNVSEKYDDNVDEGLVISQSIAAGTEVDEGTVIGIVISLGPAPFAMPNVIGKTENEAENLLGDLGLAVKKAYKESSENAKGTVLDQSIKADENVTRGTEVTIIVATSIPTIKVENVVGKTRSEAKSILEKQGFKVTESESYSNDVKKNIVISQSPAAGTDQVSGTVISLLVSRGAQEVSVKLDALGGSVSPAELKVIYGGTYGKLPEPVRSGYYFGGWYDKKDGGSVVTSETKVADVSEHTLYARWSNIQYNIKFDGNGGNVSASSKKVAFGSAYGELPVAERKGYTFDGWYTAATGGNRISKDTKVSITSDQTLYAHWVGGSVAVLFDANGGSVATKTKNVIYSEKYGELPMPTRDGYGFDGWFTAASGGTQVNPSDVVNRTDGHTLYAHWTAGKLTIKFDGNGGTASKTSITVSYNDAYGKLPSATREGYTFGGWYTAATGGTNVTEKTAAKSNTTVYAHWTINTYRVIFDGNGGTASKSSIDVQYGNAVGKLPSATREGYTFSGWYTAASGGSKVSKTNTVTGNITLYAHWNINTYTLTFDANGGSVSESSRSVTYGNAYGTLPEPKRNVSTFVGWFTEKTGGSQVTKGTKMGAADVTLYAHWSWPYITIHIEEVTEEGKILGNYDIEGRQGTEQLVYPQGHTGYTAPDCRQVYFDVEKTVSFVYTLNSYTVKVVEKASNGTYLGDYTITKKYGTTDYISPRSYTGYNAPTAQFVTWDDNKTVTFTYESIPTYTITVTEKSSNGTILGTYSLAELSGTTKSISPRSYTGYTTPSAQTVKWDSNKTITFSYAPANPGATVVTRAFPWAEGNDYMTCKVTFEPVYNTRRADSIQVKVTTELILNHGHTGYGYDFNSSCNGYGTADIPVVGAGTWSSTSYSPRSQSASTTYTIGGLSADTSELTVVYHCYTVNSGHGVELPDEHVLELMTFAIPKY